MRTEALWIPPGLAERDPKPGEVWRHHSGALVRIVGYAFNPKTSGPMVLYEHVGRAPGVRVISARNLSDFHREVTVGGQATVFVRTPRLACVDSDGCVMA